MAQTQTLQAVKDSLRIKHTELDEDLRECIDAAVADMTMCGITADENDPLIRSAIKLWVRAQNADSTADAAAYMVRYDAMKASLQMATGYGGAQDED